MESINIFELVSKVVLSWQVIVITIVIFLFLSLVSHVAKAYHRPRVKKIKTPKVKKAAAPVAAEGLEEVLSEGDSNDELGLEEA